MPPRAAARPDRRTRRRRAGLAAGALSLVAVLMAAAPAAAAPPADSSTSDIRILATDLSDLPRVSLSLSGPADLDPGDLVITEDGAVRPILRNEGGLDSGTQVMLAIDGSGSMAGAPLAQARDAARAFIERLPAEVAVGIVSFGTVPQLLATPSQDHAAVLAVLDRLPAQGKTALYDGVRFAVAQMSPAATDRHLIILSDGGDTVSMATLGDAVTALDGVMVDVVELATAESNRTNLETLANGGSVQTVNDPALLGQLLANVAENLTGLLDVEFETAVSVPSDADASTIVEVEISVDAGSSAAPPATITLSYPLGALVPPPPPTTTTTAPPVTTVPVTLPAAEMTGGSAFLRYLGALLVVLGVMGCVVALRLRPSPAAQIHRRMTRIAAQAERRADARDREQRAWLEQQLERLGLLRGLERSLLRAGMSRPVRDVAATLAIVTVLVGLVLGLMSPVLGILGLAAVPLLFRVWVNQRIASRSTKFADQLADVLQLIRNMLFSGYGLVQALNSVSDQASEPAASAFARVMLSVRSGRDLSDALEELADEMQSRDFKWVVSAIEVNRSIGGDLSQILESVIETIRERQRLRGQIRGLTAEGRMSAYLMLALPPCVMVVSALANPEYTALLFEGTGLVLLFIAIVLMVLGYLWMRRMINKVMA